MEKNNKNLNVPNLRFPEFSGEWDITTIGEISNIKNGPFGSVLHAEDYVSDGIPIVTTEHFKSGSLPIVKDGIPQVSEQDYIRLKGYKLQTNDIVISRVGSVDINAYVSDTQNGWLFSGRVLRVRPISSVNSLCLHFVLSTEKVKQGIRSRAVGQTMPSINTPILSTTNIFLPKSLEEQRKISIFLALIDARLETQKKIIEKYESLIRGLCEKLTRQGTANKTINECLECHSSTLQESSVMVGGKYPVYGATGICGYTDTPDSTGDGILIIKDGASVGVTSYAEGCYSAIGTLNRLIAKHDIHLRYVYYCLKVMNFSPYKTGLAIPHIYFKDYGKHKIWCPSYEHQLHIANILTQIDDNIQVEKSLLEQLNSQKRYMLNQLFI